MQNAHALDLGLARRHDPRPPRPEKPEPRWDKSTPEGAISASLDGTIRELVLERKSGNAEGTGFLARLFARKEAGACERTRAAIAAIRDRLLAHLPIPAYADRERETERRERLLRVAGVGSAAETLSANPSDGPEMFTALMGRFRSAVAELTPAERRGADYGKFLALGKLAAYREGYSLPDADGTLRPNRTMYEAYAAALDAGGSGALDALHAARETFGGNNSGDRAASCAKVSGAVVALCRAGRAFPRDLPSALRGVAAVADYGDAEAVAALAAAAGRMCGRGGEGVRACLERLQVLAIHAPACNRCFTKADVARMESDAGTRAGATWTSERLAEIRARAAERLAAR